MSIRYETRGAVAWARETRNRLAAFIESRKKKG